jgi:hypothetical protein
MVGEQFRTGRRGGLQGYNQTAKAVALNRKAVEIEMANDSKEEGYVDLAKSKPHVSGVVRVGLIAAASAIAGGMAVALWHRKTLEKLQKPGSAANLPNSISSRSEE